MNVGCDQGLNVMKAPIQYLFYPFSERGDLLQLVFLSCKPSKHHFSLKEVSE